MNADDSECVNSTHLQIQNVHSIQAPDIVRLNKPLPWCGQQAWQEVHAARLYGLQQYQAGPPLHRWHRAG